MHKVALPRAAHAAHDVYEVAGMDYKMGRTVQMRHTYLRHHLYGPIAPPSELPVVYIWKGVEETGR
jgi:hypothetical protein